MSTIYMSDIDIVYKNRILEMIAYFIDNRYIKNITYLLENNSSNINLLEYINKHKKKKFNSNTSRYKLTKIADSINSFYNGNDMKLLDVGVGNGIKINFLKDFLECNIYGADLAEWGNYSKRKFNFPFKIINKNPYKIPYDSNMFDCITLMLTLHHADNIIETIKECKRLLKKDGIIVIVEHDIWTDYDNFIIDFQHDIYQHIYKEKKIKNGNYYNYFEWDILFKLCGMKPIYSGRLEEDMQHFTKYDNQFITIYRKI